MKIPLFLSLVIILFVTFNCTSSKSDREKEFFSNGKVKRVYSVDSNNQRQGTAIQYHANGKLLSIEHYKDDQLNGLALVYDEQGKLKSRTTYVNNVPNGQT